MSPRRLDQIVLSLGYCSRKEVRDLVADGRIRIGGVSIGKVPVGQWRYLSGKEKF